ncbi:prepilin peptidase [Polynucleobacter paneuropaeus]|nr:prepilin peptidase [Polynucleobacter paneuropaeus]
MQAPNLMIWIQITLVLVLIYLAYVDLTSFRLPNALTIPLIFSGLGFNFLASQGFAEPFNAMLGCIFGYGFLWLMNFIYRILKKHNGIGMGDAKLLAALGAWLGAGALPEILLIASLTGLVGGFIWLKWHRSQISHAFPFGPFLAFAGIIEVLWPQALQTLLLIR